MSSVGQKATVRLVGAQPAHDACAERRGVLRVGRLAARRVWRREAGSLSRARQPAGSELARVPGFSPTPGMPAEVTHPDGGADLFQLSDQADHRQHVQGVHGALSESSVEFCLNGAYLNPGKVGDRLCQNRAARSIHSRGISSLCIVASIWKRLVPDASEPVWKAVDAATAQRN